MYTRLNHLAISISYSSLLSLLDEFGKKSDALLLKWQQDYTDIIRVVCEANSDRASLLSGSSCPQSNQVRQTEVTAVQQEHRESHSFLNEHNYTTNDLVNIINIIEFCGILS